MTSIFHRLLRSWRDAHLAQQSVSAGRVTADHEDKTKQAAAVIDSLNLTLVPPERTASTTLVDLPIDHDGDGAELLKSLTRGWEKRRELKLARAGIRYDASKIYRLIANGSVPQATAQYKTPLGFPCDPRDHPMICQKEEGESTTTTRLPVGVKLRQRRKELAEEVRDAGREPRKASDWNPFVDGPLTETQDNLGHPVGNAEFVEEEVLSPNRRRRKAEWWQGNPF